MPRKPTQRKTKVIIHINGIPVPVTLYPPKLPRKSWYAYWPGLVAARSTGQPDRESALSAASDMLQNNGRLGHEQDITLTDEEFEEIQRRHYGKKKDPAAQARAAKSLTACLEAVSAFRLISGIVPATRATPDDCERFQNEALKLPRDWRMEHPRVNREDVPTDEELRQASNRTYARLIAGLSLKVAMRYGHHSDEEGFDLEERLQAAVTAKDWKQTREILDELSSQGQ